MRFIPRAPFLRVAAAQVVLWAVFALLGCTSDAPLPQKNQTKSQGAERFATHKSQKARKRPLGFEGFFDRPVLQKKPRIRRKITKTVQEALVPPDQQAIVLFHGLNRLSYDFVKMERALKQKFPRATVVALKSVDKDPGSRKKWSSPTMVLPIQKQAELAYEEIQTALSGSKQVVLVGHSQGGLRAFALAKNHGGALERERSIVIQGLITIGTPWKGAPVMDELNDPKAVLKRLSKVKATLDAISDAYSKHVTRHIFRIPLAENFPFLFKHLGGTLLNRKAGASDLRPKSAFIQDFVRPGLAEIQIPIRAIAGVLVDFSQLFSTFPATISKSKLRELNRAYATLIGGSPTCEHDMLLPVDTQHAEGFSKRDFQAIKIQGACHGNKVGVSVKQGLSELNNDAVIAAVEKFIDGIFYVEKQIEIEIEEDLEAAAAG